MKVCLISSSGGHMTELKQVVSALPKILSAKKYNYFFITMNRTDTHDMKNTYFMVDTSRNPFTIFWNFIQSIGLFFKTKPDIVITTGGGFSVPFCYIAKLFGKKIIVFESFCRIKSKSLSSRLLYPITNRFFVQWKESLSLWGKKTEYFSLIGEKFKVSFDNFKKAKKIFVTVGSSPYQFDRFIKFVDELAVKNKDKEFYCQIGASTYEPKNCKWVRYLNYEEYNKMIKESDFVISHAGAGSVISLVSNKKPFFLFPRLKKYKEIVNDHQLELYGLLTKKIIDKDLVKYFGGFNKDN